jgi:hypothetical protein
MCAATNGAYGTKILIPSANKRELEYFIELRRPWIDVLQGRDSRTDT